MLVSQCYRLSRSLPRYRIVNIKQVWFTILTHIQCITFSMIIVLSKYIMLAKGGCVQQLKEAQVLSLHRAAAERYGYGCHLQRPAVSPPRLQTSTVTLPEVASVSSVKSYRICDLSSVQLAGNENIVPKPRRCDLKYLRHHKNLQYGIINTSIWHVCVSGGFKCDLKHMWASSCTFVFVLSQQLHC